jgi:integrase
VKNLNAAGTYADGGGLYVQVREGRTGSLLSKSWIFRFTLRGRAREMGLGSLRDVSLLEARKRAAMCREQLSAGIDPIEARTGAVVQARIAAARATTFKVAAEAFIEANKPGWRNPKHGDQWTNTLTEYAFPVLGPLPVQDVDTNLVLKVLEPIWTTKTVTADRVRQRIEAVLDAAKARGQRSGDNPARWNGHLENLLPRRSKVHKVTHHPALPYVELPDFLQRLRKQLGVAPRALEFLLLSAARTAEVIGARWTEIDVQKAMWTVPANRIKGEKEHRVPLCEPALAIIAEAEKIREDEFVFPGGKKGKGLSNNALLKLLERMKRSDITVHGFRSTFRDWAAERTNFPREVAEMALAHSVGDKVEAAYRRGDLFDKRRRLMEAWARYCTAPTSAAAVVPINGPKSLDQSENVSEPVSLSR